MSTPDKLIELYRQQEADFTKWVDNLFATATELQRLEDEVGVKNLEGWIREHCPGVDFDLCQDMLHKLHGTKAGREYKARTIL